MFAGARSRMPGISIGNLQTGETKQLSVVPTELTEQLTAEYVRHNVLGLPHRRMHYLGTDNHQFPNLSFFYVSNTAAEYERAEDERRFLLSLLYPREAVDGVARGGPPRVLFLWPSLISMTCVLPNISIAHTKFNLVGQPVNTRITLSFEEIRSTRLTSDDVRQRGTIRGS